MEPELRVFSLISETTLDDRAVEELAYGVANSGTLGGEALGALTRRESALIFGDLLEPIEPTTARERAGVRFSMTLADDPETVLGVFIISQKCAVALADLFFGGPGEGTERRLTEIEGQAITSLAGGVIAPVVGVLSGREGCHIALHQMKDAPLPSSNIVELAMTMSVGAASIDASLLVPDPDGGRIDASSREAMEAKVKDMPVDVEIDLASVEMAASEVQSLAAGDVIVFDSPQDSEAIARTGSQDLLRGRVADRGGRRILEVTEMLVSS